MSARLTDALEPMDEDRLASIVDFKITQAQRFAQNELVPIRDKALEYMRGEVDISVEAGKSSVTSNDLSDHLNWIIPGLTRAFLSTDEVVKYEPTRQQVEPDPETGQPKDMAEERAKQAQDYINYVFLSECGGYSTIRAAMQDGLVLANGILKHYWDDTPEFKVETHYGLDQDQVLQVLVNPEVEELIGYHAHSDGVAPSLPAIGSAPPVDAGGPAPPMGPGQPGMVPPGPINSPEVGGLPAPQMAPAGPIGLPGGDGRLFDIKVRRKISTGRLTVECIPPEDFLIDPNARALDEDVIFCGHQYMKTRSDLVEMGYDLEDIDDQPTGTVNSIDPTKNSRTGYGDPGYDDAGDRSTELVDVYECYIKVDYDGDGIAERRRVVMVGGTGKLHLIENEEWDDDLPFSDLVPDPVPHRWRGNSLYERLRDVVRNKTVLLRQTHDNLYHVNNPMQEVVENSVLNIKALVNRTLGANIFVKQPGSIRPLEVPFTADKSFAMLQYWDEVAERRTGVSKQSMGLDPDALQNQTAEAVRDQRAASSTKVEDYARCIENGLARAFKCILKIVHRHQDKPRTVRIRNKWVKVDPTAWDPDMNVIVNTGLGTGSRDRDIGMIANILAKQELILQTMGVDNPIVTLKEYRDTLAMAAEVSGIRSPERHFKEITDEQLAQMAQAKAQQPDPETAKIQAEAQREAAKLQMQQQIEAAKGEAEHQRQQQKIQADLQLQAAKSEADMQLTREKQTMEIQALRDKAAAEIETNRQKHALDLQLLREKTAAEMELKRVELGMEAELKREQIKQVGQQAQETNVPEASDE